MSTIASFLPIIDDEAEILVLGTMPGAMSLAKQEYYAYKQNAFWKIIYTLYAELPVSENFAEKVKLLQHHKIALWDVLAYCERKGSLDIHIKKHVENDIAGLLEEHPKIKRILFNGKESYKYFNKKFAQIKGLDYHVMPSTSPANTMKFELKLASWREALTD